MLFWSSELTYERYLRFLCCWYLFIKYDLAHGRGKSWDGPRLAFFHTSVALLFDEHLLIIYIFVFYNDGDDEIKIKLKLKLWISYYGVKSMRLVY